MKTVFGIIIIFIQFFIPFIILTFCYGRIVWMLSRRINTDMTDVNNHSKNSENTNGCNQNTTGKDQNKVKRMTDLHKDKFQLARKNTIKTLLIVGCCFITCWSQNQFFYLMYNFGYPLDWNSTYFHFTVLMVFLNCTLNPFIYLIKYQDYQIALRQFLRCKIKDKDDSQNLSTSNQTSFSTI